MAAKKSKEQKLQELIDKRKDALKPFGIEFSEEIADMSSQKFSAYIKGLKNASSDIDPGNDDDSNESNTPGDQQTGESTETKDSKKNALEKKAEKIMSNMKVDTVFMTSDGYWFTQKSLADEHERKCGGEVKVFTNKK